MKKSLTILFFVFSCLLTNSTLASDKREDIKRFVDTVFAGQTPERQRLKLDADLKAQIRKILGHKVRGSRLRYWQQDDRTVWILEEVGKTKPITTGLVVNGGKIEQLKVLKFRESRGGEIRYPFFTDQFKGIGLDSHRYLDRRIDGISGATLSVRAMKKLARVSILLHNHVLEQAARQK